MLASVYRGVRNLPDRLLHSRRHFAVRERLSRANRPRRVLVVCHGNICRSPYLQAVLQRELPDVSVTSAGFFGSDRPVPQIAVGLAAERGLNLAQYRSRPVTHAKLHEADLVIVMDSEQANQIARMFTVPRNRIVIAGDLDPVFEGSRSIRDPWNQSLDVFKSSFARLDRCASTMISMLPPGSKAS